MGWKSLIAAAEEAYRSLPDDELLWREPFVQKLADVRARTESAVNRCLNAIVEMRMRQHESEANRLRAQADAREREAHRLKKERKRPGTGDLSQPRHETGRLSRDGTLV